MLISSTQFYLSSTQLSSIFLLTFHVVVAAENLNKKRKHLRMNLMVTVGWTRIIRLSSFTILWIFHSYISIKLAPECVGIITGRPQQSEIVIVWKLCRSSARNHLEDSRMSPCWWCVIVTPWSVSLNFPYNLFPLAREKLIRGKIFALTNYIHSHFFFCARSDVGKYFRHIFHSQQCAEAH